MVGSSLKNFAGVDIRKEKVLRFFKAGRPAELIPRAFGSVPLAETQKSDTKR